MMMEQGEHLSETNQPKSFTRSTARHLRRKRLHDARKAEKQQEYLCNSINDNLNKEFDIEQEISQSEIITKSKARRLRRKNKAKLLDNCCSFCEPNCKVSSPIIEVISNQETISGKETEDIKTITKSKARRLRKKNKTKLMQSTCTFCSETYPSTIDPILLKYMQTNDYSSNTCSTFETGIADNIIQNYNTENIVEPEVNQIQYDKNEAEQTQKKSENLKLQEKGTELSCLSRLPGAIQFQNEIQTYEEGFDKTTKDTVYASQLKQNIVETFQTQIACANEELRLQGLNTKQINTVDSASNLQELINSTNFLRLDEGSKNCNIEYTEERNFDTNTPEINSIENTTSYLNKDLEEKVQFESCSEANVQFLPLSSSSELLKNVKNLQFVDSTGTIFPNRATENTEIASGEAELKIINFVPIQAQNITTTNSNKKQIETKLFSNPSKVNKNCVLNLNLQTEVDTDAKLSSVKDTHRLLSEPPILDNSQFELAKSVPSKMSNKASEKSREEIKAEREAKKAAKALAKAKAKAGNTQIKDGPNVQAASADSIKNKATEEKLERVAKENVVLSNNIDTSNKSENISAKSPVAVVSDEGKSKAELRAERRAKQEAQRAAKQQHLVEKSKAKNKEESVSIQPATQTTGTKEAIKVVITPKKTIQKDNIHEIKLFKHLYHERTQAIVNVPFVNSNIHPAIVRLGTQYACKVIVGSNARCVALLAAVKQLIKDFERPSQADFIRGLEASLQESVAYLHHCRPLAVSMQNALRHLKWQMTQLPSTLSDMDAKNKLATAIDTYILEQIQLADKAISITIQRKISNGDVILTYGYSSLIHKILLDAHIAGKQFRVVVVDGRPWLEGKEQLRRLAKHGIECSYILINALSYVMSEVSKVFLGAHAILANGAVMSRVGTAQVALMARAFNIPVLVACETHKSCERVQTDSIVYNELGNADELAQDSRTGDKKSLLTNWKNRRSLNILNITYDVTPADLVTAVVTELAILPCTSVPVILRIKPSEI